MRRGYKIALRVGLFIVLAPIAAIIIGFIYIRWGYYDDMYAIEKKLNGIDGVKVLNIWGNEDITLEEIAARIQVKDKGEIVLLDLAVGDYGYAERVSITEIGGYSFEKISCNCLSGSKGVGSALQLGTDSDFGKLLNIKFDNPARVAENYTKIYCAIDSIYHGSNPVHFAPDSMQINGLSTEIFIRVINSKSTDQDLIFNLIGIEDVFKDSHKLPWNSDSCKVARY